jgi:hypothetical protein
LEDGLLLQPETRMGRTKPYQIGAYHDIARAIANGMIYIGNIRALQAWYTYVRKPLMANDAHGQACYDGALDRLDSVIEERIKRLRELAEKMPRSLEFARADPARERASWYALQQKFLERWPEMESALNTAPGRETGSEHRDLLLRELLNVSKGRSYLEAIRALSSDAKKAGSAWLQAIVDAVSRTW